MNGASLIHPDFSYHFNPSAVKLFIPRINNKVPLSFYSDRGIVLPLFHDEYTGKTCHEQQAMQKAAMDADLRSSHPCLPGSCMVSHQTCGKQGK
jgi:hypothetical protein